MSDIEKAMSLLITSFTKHSTKYGDKNRMSKGKLKEVLQNELRGFLGNANDKADIDQFFNYLDEDKYESVHFGDFVTLVASLTQMCHEYFIRKK